MAGRPSPPPNRTRASKKTEAVEVRVSPEDKAAFMAACRARGVAASDVLRTAMRRYSSGRPQTREVLMALSILVSAGAAFWVGASLTPGADGPEAAQTAAVQAAASTGVTIGPAGEGIGTQLVMSFVSGDFQQSIDTHLLANDSGVEIAIPDIPLAGLEPTFGELNADDATLRITLKAAPGGEPDAVLYTVTVELLSGGRNLLDEPITPVLLAKAGNPARIALGQQQVDGPWAGLEISLTPSPGA